MSTEKYFIQKQEGFYCKLTRVAAELCYPKIQESVWVWGHLSWIRLDLPWTQNREKGQRFMLFPVNINIKNEKKGYCYCCLRNTTNQAKPSMRELSSGIRVGGGLALGSFFYLKEIKKWVQIERQQSNIYKVFILGKTPDQSHRATVFTFDICLIPCMYFYIQGKIISMQLMYSAIYT